MNTVRGGVFENRALQQARSPSLIIMDHGSPMNFYTRPVSSAHPTHTHTHTDILFTCTTSRNTHTPAHARQGGGTTIYSVNMPKTSRHLSKYIVLLLIVICSTWLFAASGTCDRGQFDFTPDTRRFDYGALLRTLSGQSLFDGEEENDEDSASCFLDWSPISEQIRWSRSHAKDYYVTGHHISVNGKIQLDTTPTGIYVNSPDAKYSLVSFDLDRESGGSESNKPCPEPTDEDCYFFDGDECKQFNPSFVKRREECLKRRERRREFPFRCEYVSSVGLFPKSLDSRKQIPHLFREEAERQNSVCKCDKFAKCLMAGMGSIQCGWSEFRNVFQEAARQDEFCMHRQCSFVLNGAGALEHSIDLNTFGGPDHLNHQECHQIWTRGTSKGDWHFTIQSIAFSPSTLHRNPPSVRLPSRTAPSDSPLSPSHFSCGWTKITFWKFSRTKWESPCSSCCPDGNVLSAKTHAGSFSSARARSDEEPAWVQRERARGARFVSERGGKSLEPAASV